MTSHVLATNDSTSIGILFTGPSPRRPRPRSRPRGVSRRPGAGRLAAGRHDVPRGHRRRRDRRLHRRRRLARRLRRRAPRSRPTSSRPRRRSRPAAARSPAATSPSTPASTSTAGGNGISPTYNSQTVTPVFGVLKLATVGLIGGVTGGVLKRDGLAGARDEDRRRDAHRRDRRGHSPEPVRSRRRTPKASRSPAGSSSGPGSSRRARRPAARSRRASTASSTPPALSIRSDVWCNDEATRSRRRRPPAAGGSITPRARSRRR